MILFFITIIWPAFYWFLPAGIANMAPVVASKFPIIKDWNAPVDSGKTWNNHRIFGDHKTWRGLVSGVIAAIITAYLSQYFLSDTLPFSELNPVLVGTMLGIGALGGDMIKSFFKRQMNIQSGRPWFPWDQLDYIIGGFLMISIVVKLPISFLLLTALIYFLLHLAVSFLGYRLKLKLSPI